jgi:hypothetical protein
MKKLYEVRVEAVAYVWAESARAAEREANQNITEVMDGGDMDAYECKLTGPFCADWGDSNPFGIAPEEYTDMTMNEIQEKAEQEDAKIDRDTLPLPGVP